MSKKNIESIYPLSPMQQGILFHTLYAPKSGVYVIQSCYTLSSKALNISAFEQAWQQLVNQHSILRTSFYWERHKEPFQVVHKHVLLPWKHYDWRHIPENKQQRLEAFLQADRHQGFDLAKAPLMRLTVIHLSDDICQLIWSKHHLILDGWSTALLLKQVLEVYKEICHDQVPSARSRHSYGDYIAWLQQQDLSQAKAFWQQTLKGFTAPTPLGITQNIGSLSHGEGYGEQSVKLSPTTTAALQSLARKYKLTLNTFVQGAWALLLSRYTGEEDIVFGATSSGRPPTLAGSEFMVGLFINTLPVRVQVSPEEFVLPWLQKLQARQAEIQQYEYSPLIDVQGWSDVPRDLPLFQSIVVFENYPIDSSLQEWGKNLEIGEVRSLEQTNYPITVSAGVDSQLSLHISYDCHYFNATTSTQRLEHLKTLLENIVANSNQRLSSLPLLTEAERQQLLAWNYTQVDYPQERCLHELFEAQAEQTPDAVAVLDDSQHLTYQELNQRANQLAHALRELGVGPEVLVGLYVERSLDMLVGLLGILKAGGAYLPLNPAYPQAHLADMLTDAQVAVLLTQAQLLAGLPEHIPQVVCLDTDWEAIALQPQTNPINQTKPENLVYVIYTSGTTGKPKGVMIQHRSLVNHTESAAIEYELTTRDRILQFASISFDAAAEEIFPCLVRGATLVLRTDEMLSTVLGFIEKCREWELTVLDLPTTFWHQLTFELAAGLALPKSLRLVIIGGEKALPEQLTTWNQQVGKQVRLINSYGPTETTVVATLCDISEVTTVKSAKQPVPIGRPIRNLQTYILDSYLNLAPIGVPGELYVGGVGVARGYLNQPQMTAQRFIPNPFSEQPGTCLYKTGDLVLSRADGNIEFLGRIDHQVKLRGFRIELGEIAAVLAQYPSVEEAVVLLRQDVPGNQRLVAYVVPQEQAIAVHSLRSFLQANLPDYMVPSAFVVLKTLPLTPNGKVDRRALPVPDATKLKPKEACVAPRTPIEEILSGIWTQILDLEQVGIYDNFFELGGHSLLTTRLLAQIREALLVDLPLRRLFDSPTIAGIAESIEKIQQTGHTATGSQNVVEDLSAEAILDPTIYLDAVSVKSKPEPACIFLTGATGFLGAFLLHELLQQTQADIYCLVRASSPEEGQKRLRDCLGSYLLWQECFSSRIIPVIGNLSQPLLGLSHEQFEWMAGQVDIIYHNGALVHHIYPYSVLKATNVLGTQEVLRLASKVKVKPVHFISTSSVFSSFGQSGVKVVREQDSLDVSQVPVDGYVQSKWVAEKLVTIARDRSFPICIYRPGRISGHSQTGVFNNNDFLYRLIIGCIQLGSAPDGDLMEGIVPVDYVSRAIVHLSRQEESLGKAFHLVNSQFLDASMLLDALRSFGYSLQQISYEQWRTQLLKIAGHSPEHSLYPLVPFFSARESEHASRTESLEKKSNSAVLQFDCQNTLAGLAGTSIVCPPIDEYLLGTYFSYLMQSGFLAPLQPKIAIKTGNITNL